MQWRPFSFWAKPWTTWKKCFHQVTGQESLVSPEDERKWEKDQGWFQCWDKKKNIKIGKVFKKAGRLESIHNFFVSALSPQTIQGNTTYYKNVFLKHSLKAYLYQIKPNFGLCDQRLSISKPLKARPYSIERIPDRNSIMWFLISARLKLLNGCLIIC